MSSAAGKGSFYSEKVDKDEEKEFETGPLSILMHSVKQNTQVSFFLFFFMLSFPYSLCLFPLGSY
jgi:hypothetical protein